MTMEFEMERKEMMGKMRGMEKEVERGKEAMKVMNQNKTTE